MSVRKRNEYLDGHDSEEEQENGYGSEAEEGRGAIANKRRKLDSDEDSFDGISDDEEEPKQSTKPATTTATSDSRFDFSNFGDDDQEDKSPAQHSDDHDDDDDDDDDTQHPKPHQPQPKKSRELKAYEQAHKKVKKSGVVYISRVPPFMKPSTLKHHLTPHAPHGLGRIFLTPETPRAHSKRVKAGGNKKKSYTDGWVEFHSKREARAAAEVLNGNIIGGKKGGFYHDDLWNVKYLRGFKWENLTEQISNENAERAARIREEVRRTRRENKTFVEDVERGRMLGGMERKNRGKLERGQGVGGEGIREKLERSRATQRQFKQKKVKGEGEGKEGVEKPFGAGEGVRSKIF